MEQDEFNEWISEVQDLTDEQLEELKEVVNQEIGAKRAHLSGEEDKT